MEGVYRMDILKVTDVTGGYTRKPVLHNLCQ